MSPTVPPSQEPPNGASREPSEVELYALVAARLKEAHARVRALDVSDGTRASLTRSLLLVTEAAKRDLPEAARRLGRFVDALDSGVTPLPKAP
ncbi:SCO5555 family protein [Streptacidiphilus sp. PAMC 29251]